MAIHNETGKNGENAAVKYLAERGYDILITGFRQPYGEIDIIAADDKYILFVEVKTRETTSLLQPKEFVTRAKQQKIVRTAYAYLHMRPTTLTPRFDVIEVFTDTLPPFEVCRINHIEGAFDVGRLKFGLH